MLKEENIKEEIFTSNVLFHIFMLTLVLTLMFFVVIRNTTKGAFEREINGAITDAIDSLPSFTGPVNQATVDNMIDYFNTPDKTNEERNNALLNYCIIILIALLLINITAWVLIRYSAIKKIRVRKVVLENIFLFLSVGVIEFIFFINIATKFIPVKPSFIMSEVERILKEYQ